MAAIWRGGSRYMDASLHEPMAVPGTLPPAPIRVPGIAKERMQNVGTEKEIEGRHFSSVT